MKSANKDGRETGTEGKACSFTTNDGRGVARRERGRKGKKTAKGERSVLGGEGARKESYNAPLAHLSSQHIPPTRRMTRRRTGWRRVPTSSILLSRPSIPTIKLLPTSIPLSLLIGRRRRGIIPISVVPTLRRRSGIGRRVGGVLRWDVGVLATTTTAAATATADGGEEGEDDEGTDDDDWDGDAEVVFDPVFVWCVAKGVEKEGKENGQRIRKRVRKRAHQLLIVSPTLPALQLPFSHLPPVPQLVPSRKVWSRMVQERELPGVEQAIEQPVFYEE
jgi:hypothetical protein